MCAIAAATESAFVRVFGHSPPLRASAPAGLEKLARENGESKRSLRGDSAAALVDISRTAIGSPCLTKPAPDAPLMMPATVVRHAGLDQRLGAPPLVRPDAIGRLAPLAQRPVPAPALPALRPAGGGGGHAGLARQGDTSG